VHLHRGHDGLLVRDALRETGRLTLGHAGCCTECGTTEQRPAR
jgi:hypothetical protein